MAVSMDYCLVFRCLHALISAIGTLQWYQSGLHVCIVILIALLNSVLCAYMIAEIFCRLFMLVPNLFCHLFWTCKQDVLDG